MGTSNLLPMSDVVLISIWFMISNVQNAFYLYLMGSGLFNEMRLSYIFSTCFNLTMNLLLGKLFGVTGIILASLLSCLISGTFWQCNIIFKCYFNESAKKYISKQFLYFIIAGCISTSAYFACDFIRCGGWSEFFLKLLICIAVTVFLLVAIYRKNKCWVRTVELVSRMMHRNNN